MVDHSFFVLDWTITTCLTCVSDNVIQMFIKAAPSFIASSFWDCLVTIVAVTLLCIKSVTVKLETKIMLLIIETVLSIWNR